jgi:hypothetical protein
MKAEPGRRAEAGKVDDKQQHVCCRGEYADSTMLLTKNRFVSAENILPPLKNLLGDAVGLIRDMSQSGFRSGPSCRQMEM